MPCVAALMTPWRKKSVPACADRPPQLLRRDTDGARNASAAEAAIALRILREILLVIGFGVIKIRPLEDLRCDCSKAPRGHSFGEARLSCLRGGALGRVFDIDGGAILGANIVALPHPLGRIIALPKSLYQRFIGNLCRVESDQHDFVMASRPGADFLVGGVRGKAARVSGRRHMDTVAELPKLALGAPETAHAEQRGRDAPWERRRQSVPGYEMGSGGQNRVRPSGQSLGGGRQGIAFAERKHGTHPSGVILLRKNGSYTASIQ